MHHSFSRHFAPPLAAIAFILALLLAKWAGASEPMAAEQPYYRLPGGCVVTITVDARGRIIKRTRCEYTQAQRDRMAREGN